jgi:hypothetical protein
MSITHSLPLSEWYRDTTSPWTLDYPPLFAWFEYLLSQVAAAFHPQMLVLRAAPYESWHTTLLQRTSLRCDYDFMRLVFQQLSQYHLLFFQFYIPSANTIQFAEPAPRQPHHVHHSPFPARWPNHRRQHPLPVIFPLVFMM